MSQDHIIDKLLKSGSVKAAKGLIGYELYIREADGSLTGGVIVETEAYTQDDAASHTYNGRTVRNSIMFQEARHIYVYFTYGMHWCMNIVTGQIGQGEAVLIRAIQPTKGIEKMYQRRKNISDSDLTNGPAKLCQALAISGQDNGEVINHKRFMLNMPDHTYKVMATKRMGITKDTHRLWRFVAVD